MKWWLIILFINLLNKVRGLCQIIIFYRIIFMKLEGPKIFINKTTKKL